MSEIKIGQEIESFCGKCKSNTIHVITSIDHEKMDKLMCKICNAYHKYRKPKEAAQGIAESLSTKKEKEVKPKKRRTRRDKWSRLLDTTNSESAVDYKMDINYELATAINHKSFGIGVVKSIIDTRKIEVLFHDGERLLVQNVSA